MPNTYSGDPSSSPLDAVRFHLADTDETTYELEDVEIDYALSLYSNNVLQTAVYLAGVIAAKYASKRDRTLGPLSISYEAQYRRWIELQEKMNRLYKNGSYKTITVASAELFGGGDKYLAPDDTPLTYDEGSNAGT